VPQPPGFQHSSVVIFYIPTFRCDILARRTDGPTVFLWREPLSCPTSPILFAAHDVSASSLVQNAPKCSPECYFDGTHDDDISVSIPFRHSIKAPPKVLRHRQKKLDQSADQLLTASPATLHQCQDAGTMLGKQLNPPFNLPSMCSEVTPLGFLDRSTAKRPRIRNRVQHR
jgi:hypothetical protein